MNARNLMSREATKFKNIILNFIEYYGYFPFPDDLDRFSPINYHGVPYNYSNQVKLYYESLARNYTSRVYVDIRDLSSLDIRKGREWLEKDRIIVNKFKYKSTKAYLNDNEYVKYDSVVRNGFENIYNISVIPEIDENSVESEVVHYNPDKLLEYVISFTEVVSQSVDKSSEFRYDKDNQVINVRDKKLDESIYDYLFKYISTLMNATGKLYCHEYQYRLYAKKSITSEQVNDRISFEEMMTTNFATLMYLTNFGIDISKLNPELTRTDDGRIIDYLISIIKKNQGCLFHYANDAQSAIFALRNHHK